MAVTLAIVAALVFGVVLPMQVAQALPGGLTKGRDGGRGLGVAAVPL
jgi:hypothetical protein